MTPRKRLTLPKILAVTVVACGTPGSQANDSGPEVADASTYLPDGGLDCTVCTVEDCLDGYCEPLPDGDGGQSCQCLS
jgi:hypothetical protein